jgi:hypothetical protein
MPTKERSAWRSPIVKQLLKLCRHSSSNLEKQGRPEFLAVLTLATLPDPRDFGEARAYWHYLSEFRRGQLRGPLRIGAVMRLCCREGRNCRARGARWIPAAAAVVRRIRG